MTLNLCERDRALLRLAALLRSEATGIWTSFAGPGSGAEWSLDVDPGIARRFRHVLTLNDFFEAQEELRRAYGPPLAVPEDALRPPGANIPMIATNTFVAVDADNEEVFLFDGEQLRLVDEVTFFALGGTKRAIQQFGADELAQLSLGAPLSKMFADGTLAKGTGDPIYVIEHGCKRWIPDVETLAAFSKKQPYRIISDDALEQIPDGPPIPSVNAKRQFRSPLFGRLTSIPPAVGFAADLVTLVGAVAGIAKLARLW